jgi:hypothetical protein
LSVPTITRPIVGQAAAMGSVRRARRGACGSRVRAGVEVVEATRPAVSRRTRSGDPAHHRVRDGDAPRAHLGRDEGRARSLCQAVLW